MKCRFFLVYLPLMVAVGILSIWLAERYNGVVTLSGYRIDKSEKGVYSGEEIIEYSDSDKKELREQDSYNGSMLKDNGMPYAIKVNKEKNVVTVYELGDSGFYDRPVKAMVCSVGETGNTPEGIFSLGERYRWRALFGDCYGQYAVRITGNILFHSVPYYTRDNADLEVEEYNRLGESVSAGCVRLSVIDVKWIYDNCDNNTMVEIFESAYDGPMGKPVAAHIEKSDDMNWDPTDPDEDNPYMANIPVIMGAYDREIERYSDFDITAGISAVDGQGEDITGYIKTKGKVNGDICGDYSVTYSVTDDNNESASVTAHFKVIDNESPVLEVHQVVDTIAVSDTTSGKRLVELLRENVTAYDGGEVLPEDSITVDYSEMMDMTFGTCHVKYRAKDSEGNVSDVVVLSVDVDLEAPTLTLKNEFQRDIRKNKVQDDDYLLSLVEASDNSGEVEVKLSKPLFYYDDTPYKVMYYAKDKVGNITTLSVTYQLN